LSAALKTKDVLIEICARCNTLHVYNLIGGLIDPLGKDSMACNTQIGELPDPEKGLVPILCTEVVKVSSNNTFTIRRWSFKERQEFYNVIGAFKEPVNPGSIDSLRLNIKPEVMNWAIKKSVVKAPMPLQTDTDLDSATLDGTIMEALYGEILRWNAPPLAQLSVSLRRSIQRIRPFAMETP